MGFRKFTRNLIPCIISPLVDSIMSKKISRTVIPPPPLYPSFYLRPFFPIYCFFFHDHRRLAVEDSRLSVPLARAHRYYIVPELCRHKNVTKRPRTGRTVQQIARKIKGNGDNGHRTASQANIFVFLHTIRGAVPA